MDTNTPKDSSADINHVEQLWRKRFHLDDTPIMKFHQYLKNPSDWERMQDNDSGYFYKYFPEYTITSEKDESRTGYEYYMFGQINTAPSWWLITLRYYQTAIEQLQGIALDGGNVFVVAPMREYDLYRTSISPFGFYIWDDLRYRLLGFFHAKESAEEYPYTIYMKAITLFQSESEHTDFCGMCRRILDVTKNCTHSRTIQNCRQFLIEKGTIWRYFGKNTVMLLSFRKCCRNLEGTVADFGKQ